MQKVMGICHKEKFSRKERRLIFGMGLLTGIRTLGASLVMPVFSCYAMHLAGATERMVGVAIGVFGVSQTLFQVPLGSLSDRWGGKRTLVFGSLIYIFGTILCGLSRDVYLLAAARFLAGAGAVSGVALSCITAGVNGRRRNEAVSYLGICIGLAVMAGFPLGWIIAAAWDAGLVFFACAFFALAALGYTVFLVDEEDMDGRRRSGSRSFSMKKALRFFTDRDLARLNAAGFIGNACLTSVFFALPVMISRDLPAVTMWKVFVPAAVIGTAAMYRCARRADEIGTRRIARAGFALELVGVMLPLASRSPYLLMTALTVFYSGHCILSPILPVAVSRFPDRENRGTVMSIFTASQFMGTGAGGVVGGFLMGFSPDYLFCAAALLSLGAVVVMSGYGNFQRHSAAVPGGAVTSAAGN